MTTEPRIAGGASALPAFTVSELTELAEFVCGRVDALIDIVASPRLPESSKRECYKGLDELDGLDTKLRPFYKAEVER